MQHFNAYCIALNFRGSKFSRIAIFEDFVENTFANSLHAHTAHVICYGRSKQAWFIHHTPSHYHPLARVCSCQQTNAYFEVISLERVLVESAA